MVIPKRGEGSAFYAATATLDREVGRPYRRSGSPRPPHPDQRI